MVEVLELAMQLLCQQDTLSKCEEFISGYADPLQQVLFFLFFPAIFIIIFIEQLSSIVTSAKRYSTLFGVAVFIFIVIQGWFHYFLLFGKYWFMSVIIIGGFFVMLRKMGPGGGGEKGKGGSRVVEEAGKNTADMFVKAITGGRELNPLRSGAQKEAAKIELKEIEQLRAKLEERLKNATDRQKEPIEREVVNLIQKEHELRLQIAGKRVK